MNSFRFFRRRFPFLGSPSERADRRYKPLSCTSDLLSTAFASTILASCSPDIVNINMRVFLFRIYQEFPIALSVLSFPNPPVLMLFSVVFKDSKIWSFLGLQGLPDLSRLFGIVGSVSFFYRVSAPWFGSLITCSGFAVVRHSFVRRTFSHVVLSHQPLVSSIFSFILSIVLLRMNLSSALLIRLLLQEHG